jgi:histidinol-phosphate/aromatic aminotransferase/cobyric acid decarboxylase-like protein
MIAPRAEVADAQVAEHGGRFFLDESRAAAHPVRYDFSACLNAFGPAEVVSLAIAQARSDEYPDPYSRVARHAAAARWGCTTPEIALGAGAAELIHAVCFAYLQRGDDLLIAAPAFGEYARAASLCGARPRLHPPADGAGSVDLHRVAADVERTRPRLVFIAAPVSPTGQPIARDDLRMLADRCQAADSLLVLEQAYDAFTATPLGTPALPGHPAVLHLRSLTKDHALASVRVAFAVGAAAVIDVVERVRVPWAASAAAQAAAAAAMTDDALAHVARTTAALRAQAARVAATCAALGLETSRSCTHYLVIRCGSGRAARDNLLARHGILVRDCGSFGLPEWIRVAARTPLETDALVAALSDLEAS